MGFWDTGIAVYASEFDDQGRDLGEKILVLKEGKRDGVYLMDPNAKGKPTLKTFKPSSVTVFRETGMQDKSVLGRAAVGMMIAGPLGGVIGGISGTGRKDAWYIEIVDNDGSSMVMRLRNQADGNSMKKRIEKHIAKG